ncbi:TetR/AcrR family transcriptional regulator [Anaerolineales bacterium HSG25]|nr:TetR/AcrR family transcriptional regulator [Anaerolineales bacterium HSG25]
MNTVHFLPTPIMTNESEKNHRRAILDAARQILIQDGYKNLSMRKIARQIGGSQGTIYLYFQNKDAIFYALIDEGSEKLYGLYETILNTPAEPQEHLTRICQAYINFGLENPSYYEIMHITLPMMTERFPKEQYRRARRFLELTAQTLQTCAAQKGETLSEPYLEATLLWATMHGVVSLIIAQRIDIRLDRERLIEQTIHRATSHYL